MTEGFAKTMAISNRTIDILTLTARQLSGTADVAGLLDHAVKGPGDSPMGYTHAAEVCRAAIDNGEVTLTPILVVGSSTARITPARIATAYRRRIGEPIQYARIRLYGQA